MRRLVFYVDPNADPLVETGSIGCGDDAAPVNTSMGLVRADEIVVGSYSARDVRPDRHGAARATRG